MNEAVNKATVESTKKKVDYEHFSRFRQPHNLRARGEELYFCLRCADMEKNRYREDLWRLKNGELRRLTDAGDAGQYWPGRDGLLFPARRSDADKEKAKSTLPFTTLYCLPYDGGEAQPVLTLDYAAEGFLFPDGGTERFLFVARYSHADAAALAAAQGDREKAFAARKQDADYEVLDELPYWFNGANYINKSRSRLYLYERGTVTPLTDEWTNVNPLALTQDKLYYACDTYRDRQHITDRLYELDLKTLSATELLLPTPASVQGLTVLSDGAQLLFAGIAEKHGLNENAKLYRRETDGRMTLLNGTGLHGFYGSVGSDVFTGCGVDEAAPQIGDKLYLTDTQDTDAPLIAVDVRTGEVERVTPAHGSIGECVRFGEGFAVTALRGGQGQELYAVALDGSETQLSHFNTTLAEEYAYSKPEPLFTVNERGDTIHGFVIKPVGFTEGKRYPAVFDVHGGPKTAYGDVYFHEMQLWASRGFAVFFCNPTGSDGKGDAFADIRGAYGTVDFRDLMGFCDAVLRENPWIDTERVCVTGGSYGGFMTNWIIGHSTRFVAAASQRSISNWISFSNSSDIGEYFASDQVAGDAWTGLERIWEQSPLKYADRVKTPTLFIHSEEDRRCWMAEGLQMFYALKHFGVEARLCLFRGENHELSRSGKPLHRIRRLTEITEWFEAHCNRQTNEAMNEATTEEEGK